MWGVGGLCLWVIWMDWRRFEKADISLCFWFCTCDSFVSKIPALPKSSIVECRVGEHSRNLDKW